MRYSKRACHHKWSRDQLQSYSDSSLHFPPLSDAFRLGLLIYLGLNLFDRRFRGRSLCRSRRRGWVGEQPPLFSGFWFFLDLPFRLCPGSRHIGACITQLLARPPLRCLVISSTGSCFMHRSLAAVVVSSLLVSVWERQHLASMSTSLFKDTDTTSLWQREMFGLCEDSRIFEDEEHGQVHTSPLGHASFHCKLASQ